MNIWTSLLLLACFGAHHDFVMATHQPENDFSYVLNHHKRFWDLLDDEEIARTGMKIRDVSYKEGYVQQPLDHFEVQTTGKFLQKYYAVEQYWRKPDGPVFLYIGGEWTMGIYEFTNGPIADLAETEGALILALEHRFYGDISSEFMKLDQLNYLSSHQALADLVSFRDFAVEEFGLTEKNLWISFGCSYPGALTAWFRLKYPHLVHGAVSSSGPVRAKANFKEYNEVVASAFGDPAALGSEQCASRIKSAFKAVDTMLKNEQLSELQQAFNICYPLTALNDRKIFASYLQGTFQGAAQYNVLYDIPSGQTVGGLCKIMTNETFSDPLDALKAVFFKHVGGVHSCVDSSYNGFISYYRNESFVSSGRPWMYQTCTEYGYYQTCDNGTDCMFLDILDVDMWLQFCKDVFGVDASDVLGHVDFTNSYNGADKPWGSRVVFVNGDLDPWHALSVQQDRPESLKAVMIRGASHCQDTRAATASYDSEALKAGRIVLKNEVKKWLDCPNGDCSSSPDPPGRSIQPALLLLGAILAGYVKR